MAWLLYIFQIVSSYMYQRESFREDLTRSSKDRLQLDYPKTHVQAGDKSFTVCASKLWNNIPVHIRQSVSVNAFKKALKTYLFPN